MLLIETRMDKTRKWGRTSFSWRPWSLLERGSLDFLHLPTDPRYALNVPWNDSGPGGYAWSAGSFPPGGGHALLVDGSARFVGENAGLTGVIAPLISIRGGEIIANF